MESDETILARKLANLFPEEAARHEATAILLEFSGARLKLALLKIAGGNIAALRHGASLARDDFRDVLVAAENRRANRLFGRSITSERREEAERLDRLEYEDWLSQ